MNSRSPAFRPLALALAACGLAVAGAPALADDMTEIIVEAPNLQRSHQTVPPIGAGIDIASVRYRVGLKDLDLTTAAGMTALEKRVTDAAKRACKQLDTAIEPGTTPITSDPPCVKTAVDDAMKRARAAVAAKAKGP